MGALAFKELGFVAGRGKKNSVGGYFACWNCESLVEWRIVLMVYL
jgi:hypothetical protein